MKIVTLEAENVKKLKAVRIEPEVSVLIEDGEVRNDKKGEDAE